MKNFILRRMSRTILFLTIAFFGNSPLFSLHVFAFQQSTTDTAAENASPSDRKDGEPQSEQRLQNAQKLRSQKAQQLQQQPKDEAARPLKPLFDHPELLKQLDTKEPVWVTTDRQNVVLVGHVCLREGLLEFFACRRGTKEYESIISLDVTPHLIHAALLVIGAKQGSPAKFDPVVVPPSGEEIEIQIRWNDTEGNRHECPAQEFIREVRTHEIMRSPWVFTGGLFGTDPDGKKYYLANVTGEIFGVSNFPGAVLDVPFESSSDDSNLYYEPNTEKIPEVGTEVTLILYRKNRPEKKTE